MTAKDQHTPSVLVRTNSYLTLETSDSDSCEGSIRLGHQPLKDHSSRRNNSHATTATMSSRSSGSILDMSDEELMTHGASFLPSLQSALKVKTHAESLEKSLDERLTANKEVTTPSVVFDKLIIREYARRPSCNPGCRVGISLEIEWEHQDEVTVSLEDYEATRPDRRDRGELNIPAEIRMQMLRDSGFSRGEILQYVKMANITRGQRARTNETLQLAGAEELAQKIMRGFRNKTTRRSAKKKERHSLRQSLMQDQKLMQLRRCFMAPSAAAPVAWKREPSSKHLEMEPEQAPEDTEEEEVFEDQQQQPVQLEVEC